VGYLQGAVGILLDHQHGETAAAQSGDGGEDLILIGGRESARRLVEEEELRPRLQHHGGFEDLLLASAEIAREHGELGGEERKPRERLIDRRGHRGAAQREGTQLEVLPHRHEGKIAAALRHETDTELQSLAGEVRSWAVRKDRPPNAGLAVEGPAGWTSRAVRPITVVTVPRR
jgi:hypothetical protein